MNRDLTGRRPHFRPEKRHSNPYRVLLLITLIAAGGWLFVQMQSGQVEPLFMPTATPTRTADSYSREAETLFSAGDIEAAILAYEEATRNDPNNAHMWAELARIQTYSSSLLSTDEERLERMEEALYSIDQAVSLNPDDGYVHAIRSFALDWYAANLLITPEQRRTALTDAEGAAVRALQLDPENALALAFYAEILVDQQKWAQAEEYIAQAAAIDQNQMDIHRVYGYVWESLGQYRLAIEEYNRAATITPNMTFLYIFIGRNFRSLEVNNRALEYFEKAVNINQQLGVKDPVPYIEIAKTYSRDGEFFVAALNAEKALEFDPYSANTYGQLGIIYTKARNYEGAQPVLKCAVRGCTATENTIASDLLGQGVEVQGLPLTSGTVAFYYVQYGSVLAALSRPNQNYCPEALEVLNEVRITFPDDAVLMGIIEENEAICRLVQEASGPPG
jgi:tetratricopeptide (TPR) repeat protein